MRIEVATEYYPRLTKWHVRQVLKWIKPFDLAGIEYICLMNEDSSDPEARKQPVYLRGIFYPGEYVKGNKHKTHINLYTRDAYIGIPSLLKFTPIATLRIGHIIAHEVAHHIISEKGYIYEPTEKYKYKASKTADKHEEVMCDKYAFEVLRRMFANWYYNLGRLLTQKLSNLLFEGGIKWWKEQNYKKAAYYWFYAYCADPGNADAASAWHKAKEMLTSKMTVCDHP